MAKQPKLPKPTDAFKRLTAKADGRAKKKSKADNCFKPKLVDQNGAPPPCDITCFKDGQLAAHLNRVAFSQKIMMPASSSLIGSEKIK